MAGLPKTKKESLLDSSHNAIGRRLARIRKERGFTQKELAEHIGVTRTVVTDYECGRIRMYDEILARIATALHCSIDMLLGVTPLQEKEYEPRLRYVKRIRELEKLPETKQKLILKTIDDLIRANALDSGTGDTDRI